MNFEDLKEIIIFLSIVIVISIFRSIKEARGAKAKKSKPAQPSSLPEKPSELKGEKPLVPRRKIIIRTEDVEIPIPQSVGDEKSKDSLPTVVVQEEEVTTVNEVEGELFSRPLEQDFEGEGLPVEKSKMFSAEVVKERFEKIDRREGVKPPVLVKPLYKKEITFTAPMERVGYTPVHVHTPTIGKNILVGVVGGIPQLHWAIIMTELLGPPKSLRDEF